MEFFSQKILSFKADIDCSSGKRHPYHAPQNKTKPLAVAQGRPLPWLGKHNTQYRDQAAQPAEEDGLPPAVLKLPCLSRICCQRIAKW
jgi:hypothetical protein